MTFRVIVFPDDEPNIKKEYWFRSFELTSLDSIPFLLTDYRVCEYLADGMAKEIVKVSSSDVEEWEKNKPELTQEVISEFYRQLLGQIKIGYYNKKQ